MVPLLTSVGMSLAFVALILAGHRSLDTSGAPVGLSGVRNLPAVQLRLLGGGPGPSMEGSGLAVALESLFLPAVGGGGGGGGPVASAREPRLAHCPVGTVPRGFGGCISAAVLRGDAHATGGVRHAATHFAEVHAKIRHRISRHVQETHGHKHLRARILHRIWHVWRHHHHA